MIQVFVSFNQTALDVYRQELNSMAIVREYLINCTIKLMTTGIHSIKLQALSLVELTYATNQLTQLSSVPKKK